METLHILVVTLFLIVPNILSKITQYRHPPQLSLWTLTVRDRIVSISQNGTLTSEPHVPTLYSIFRSELYIDENEPYSLPEFSLVGIASGYRICMDRKGYVYTKKVTKKEKQWLNRLSHAPNATKIQFDEYYDNDDGEDEMSELDPSYRRNLFNQQAIPRQNVKKPHHPPVECLFKAYGFDSTHSYDYKTAIYRAAASRHNSSRKVGNFVAFLKNGETRRYRRPLENLRMHSSIALSFDPIRKPATSSIITRSNFYSTNNNNSDKKVENMLSKTQFKYCGSGKPGRKLFNMKVRQCVRNATKSLNLSRLNHTNLSKIIQKCLCPLDKICRQNQCVAIKNNGSKGKKLNQHRKHENRINKQLSV